MPRYQFLFLLIFLTGNTFAQNVHLHCINKNNGIGTSDLLIKAIDSKTGKTISETFTDNLGNATLNISKFPIEIKIESSLYSAQPLTLLAADDKVISYTITPESKSLNQVVITGLARPTRADEAVAVYKVITAADIQKQGATNVSDALRNQIGLNIGNDQMLGSSISMRGMSGNNIKILVDGLPINGRENGNIDLGQFNVNNIERIEVVQGPMSIMYGTDALGGVVNIITKTNKHNYSLGGSTYYGSIGQYNYSINGAALQGKNNLSINAGRNFFQGWDPNDKNTRSPLWKPKEQYFTNLKYIYKINDDAQIRYSIDYMHEKLSIKGSDSNFSYYNRNVFDMFFFTQRAIQRLQAKWKTSNKAYWETNNSFAIYDRVRKTYVVDLSTMDRTLSSSSGDQSHIAFNDFTSRTTYNNRFGKVTLTLGYDINMEFAKGDETLLSSKEYIGDYALFTTADIKLWPQLTLQPAFRVGYNTAYTEPITPSFSFLYKPDKYFSLRGSYARGFRSPALKELYLDFVDNNHNVFGNQNLKAEYGNHYQLSAAYDLQHQDFKKCMLSITTYYDDVHNQITLMDITKTPVIGQVDSFVYTNIGRTRFLTTSLKTEYQNRNIKLIASVAYNKSFYTKNTLENGQITVTPAFHYWELGANAIYTITKWNMDVAAFYKYTGSQPQLGGDILGNAVFGSTVKDYHNIDASISKHFYDNRILFSIGVRNIANNVILNYTGVGGSSGIHSSGSGVSLTTGRNYFATLCFQLSK